MPSPFDLIVIGSGPGGYVAAIRAAQLGLKTACIDRQYLGGTCANVGCIPSKAWLESSYKFYEAGHSFSRHGIKAEVSVDVAAMAARKDQVVKANTSGVAMLLRKNKVEVFMGSARITSPGQIQLTLNSGGQETLAAKNILIATGSAPVQLPSLPVDGKLIISSDEAVGLTAAPRRLIIVGAGAIGLELGSVWSRLGSEVLVLEFMDRILPGMDREMTTALHRLLEKQGLKFLLKTSAESARPTADGRLELSWTGNGNRGLETCDRLLVAVGRRPCTDGLGLAELGVETDKKGFVRVDANFATNIPGLRAIGDVIGGAMLAHKASEEGIAAVELIAGHAGRVNYAACPNVVYTHPELASVGLTEEDAQKAGRPLRIGKFPFLANGRARCMDDTDGLVKVIADAETDRLLGMHILCSHASDLIAEAVLAMEFAASVEDIARAFHAHPTLPEAIKEAALAAEKRAIHM